MLDGGIARIRRQHHRHRRPARAQISEKTMLFHQAYAVPH
jgi:hypothetical protein